MRRAMLGDVYVMKLPNGYKIFQWAYLIPRKGEFIRVFDGLYDAIPEDIERIVGGAHSYIIAFYASRAYRIGLASFIANLPVPEKYPFPHYSIEFFLDSGNRLYFVSVRDLRNPPVGPSTLLFDVTSMKELPLEYREIKLVAGFLSPDLVMCLFDYNFDMDHPERFFPQVVLGGKWKERLEIYSDRVGGLLEKDKEKRRRKKEGSNH